MCYMWIPPVVTAVQGVFGAWGAYEDAKAHNRQMDYNASVNANNASLQREEARYIRGQTTRNVVESRKEMSVLMGAQRAKMGASGAVVDSGSFLDITLSTREEGEKDAMAIAQQGDVDAWRHDVQAGEYERQAQMYRSSKRKPRNVLIGGLLSAGANTAMSFGMTYGLGSLKASKTSPGFSDPLSASKYLNATKGSVPTMTLGKVFP